MNARWVVWSSICLTLACGGPGDPVVDAGPLDTSCGATQWPTYPCTGTTFEEKARCVPGLSVVRVPEAGRAGYERYDLRFLQPVDHEHPDAGQFSQRVVVLHARADAPVVMMTSGYDLSLGTQLTGWFGANQVSYEHRYFGQSKPSAIDYRTLTIRQAAGDAHRIAEALHWLYPAKWVSTGISKGGMTALFNRRFNPCDVDATVAYAAPVSHGLADPIYGPFLDAVGGAPWAACREGLVAFQKRLLARRDVLVPQLLGEFTLIGADKAFELAVIELYFAFWQYTKPTNPDFGCAKIPPEGADDATMLAFLEAHSSPRVLAGDDSVRHYAPYYYQSLNELGFPAPYEAKLAGLLKYAGADNASTFMPPEIPRPAFDASSMLDIEQWLASKGERVMLVYGEFDPWSARPFVLGQAIDSFNFIVPGGTHLSGIGSLVPTDQEKAIKALERWLNTRYAPMLRAPPSVTEERRPR